MIREIEWGKGRDFYDRFIRRCRDQSSVPTFIGVCFRSQIVDRVVCSDFDESMDQVIWCDVDNI